MEYKNCDTLAEALGHLAKHHELGADILKDGEMLLGILADFYAKGRKERRGGAA